MGGCRHNSELIESADINKMTPNVWILGCSVFLNMILCIVHPLLHPPALPKSPPFALSDYIGVWGKGVGSVGVMSIIIVCKIKHLWCVKDTILLIK